MIRLKNKPRAVIVVYDDDESIASRAATTLTQRGYDNVFMLSGMKNIHQRIPSKILFGQVGSEWREENFQRVW